MIEKCECRKFEGNHEKSWVENYGEVCPLCLVCFIRSGHVAPWASKTLPRWHVKKYASKHPSSFVFLIASQLSKLNPKSWYFQFQGHSKYRIGEISRPIYLSIYLSIHPSIHPSIDLMSLSIYPSIYLYLSNQCPLYHLDWRKLRKMWPNEKIRTWSTISTFDDGFSIRFSASTLVYPRRVLIQRLHSDRRRHGDRRRRRRSRCRRSWGLLRFHMAPFWSGGFHSPSGLDLNWFNFELI